MSDLIETEAALAERSEALERSNAELQQFAYVASHDLQEPLRMVASFTQLLEQRLGDSVDEKGKQYIHYIVDGAKRMQALIADLLTLSRVDTQGGPFEPLDLSDVLAAVRTDLAGQIADSGGRIEAEALPLVRGDRRQLHQVFLNLVQNALKFRSDQAPDVRINSTRVAGAWEIRVADNGIGIAEKHRDSVFEIFRRLHRRDVIPGTGIGLAVVKKIVARHGGDVWIEPAEPQGSTFCFTIADKAGDSQ